MSVRYSERLITRFGSRAVLTDRAGADRGRAWCCSRVAPARGGYVEHILPVMVLLGAGAGLCFPPLMGLAMSGATAEDAGLASGWSTRPARSAARSGWRCWPPSRPAGRSDLLAAARAGRGGADRRLPPGLLDRRGLVAVAIGVAALVLRPSPATLAAEADLAEGDPRPAVGVAS